MCSACHSLKLIAFRNLVGVSHTEEEVRELAETYQIEDGPDETGEMYTRPGRVRAAVLYISGVSSLFYSYDTFL